MVEDLDTFCNNVTFNILEMVYVVSDKDGLSNG